MAAGYGSVRGSVQEFAADDAADEAAAKACEDAYNTFEKCAYGVGNTKQLDDALNDAWGKVNEACGEKWDKFVAVCDPDATTFDEKACDDAETAYQGCEDENAKTFGIDEKEKAAGDAKNNAAEGACKSQAEAIDKACPEDDQGEDDQGDSAPQM